MLPAPGDVRNPILLAPGDDKTNIFLFKFLGAPLINGNFIMNIHLGYACVILDCILIERIPTLPAVCTRWYILGPQP